MRHPGAVEWTLAILATCAMGCSGVRAESESTAEAGVERRTVEDVFLLTGELAAVRTMLQALRASISISSSDR